MESKDAHADEAEFRAAGIFAAPTMRFEREGKHPDGTTVKVAFSLTFAEDKTAPRIHFATCQQHYPENFWNPAFQKHANSASGIAGVVAVAEQPERHAQFFTVFAGSPPTRITGGFTIETPRGIIDMLTPVAFVQRFGVMAPDVSYGPRLAALRFLVEDASLLQGIPEQAGMAGVCAGNPTVIGLGDAMGAVLIFEAAPKKAR